MATYFNANPSRLPKARCHFTYFHTISCDYTSKDLISRYPDDRGYSIRNLRYMKRFASEYPDFPIWQVPLAKLKELPILQVTLAKLESEGKEFVQVPLAQISWYHHISLLSKVKKRITQPMGIAQYETEKLFADVASALPQD